MNDFWNESRLKKPISKIGMDFTNDFPKFAHLQIDSCDQIISDQDQKTRIYMEISARIQLLSTENIFICDKATKTFLILREQKTPRAS